MSTRLTHVRRVFSLRQVNPTWFVDTHRVRVPLDSLRFSHAQQALS